MSDSDMVARTFRDLVESADRKFTRVRDVPPYGQQSKPNHHYFHNVFKAYTHLWKYQQENRSKLVNSGLQRWEIGEIASRIGQLYYDQYTRTSEARFLLESYVFYEAILNRGYFRGGEGGNLALRFKELRFYARFLLVSLVLGRFEMVSVLMHQFGALVDDSKVSFRDAYFKEWKLVIQEINRFMKENSPLLNVRPLRYCVMYDSHPDSFPYVARFHAKRILKFQDAVLASFHWNEVKFAEVTLDTFRMLQGLEWEPSGSFYKKRPVELYQNGVMNDHSGTSGLIDINLSMEMNDPNLPPNPRKAVLYRPSVTHLIAVIAMVCEDLSPDSIILIYLSAPGKSGINIGNVSSTDSSGGSRKSSKKGPTQEQKSYQSEVHANDKGESIHYGEKYLWFGPMGNKGSNNLYPGDIIPFTRRPLFLVIDSDNSHAFKVLHGAEKGETAALLLSPLRPSFRNQSGVNTPNGSQFTLFLTAPLQALSQLIGISLPNFDTDDYDETENILSSAFSKWETILCTSTKLNLVWAQVLSDPFLRRLILRFIFCRSVLHLFCPPEDADQYLPICLPELPSSLSTDSEVIQSTIHGLAKHLGVADYFHFNIT